jgi:CheY-like chemotaxis protein
MNCPRCKSTIGPLANPDAIVTCPGCGTRLMTRAAALRSQGGGPPVASSPPTVPSPSPAPEPEPEPLGHQTAVKVGKHTVSGKSSSGAVRAGGRRSERGSDAALETVLGEIQAIRETQQEILEALASLTGRFGVAGSAASPATDGTGETPAGGTTLSPIRAAARKSVILIDDNAQTRQAAVDELQRADIPVRAFADGTKALAAVAAEKPDVIILELAVGGEMAGKDLVNMIKATMEWVDIPIVLWTRENVSNQREARQIHGADEVVTKSAGPAALVARVISLFRR